MSASLLIFGIELQASKVIDADEYEFFDGSEGMEQVDPYDGMTDSEHRAAWDDWWEWTSDIPLYTEEFDASLPQFGARNANITRGLKFGLRDFRREERLGYRARLPHYENRSNTLKQRWLRRLRHAAQDWRMACFSEVEDTTDFVEAPEKPVEVPDALAEGDGELLLEQLQMSYLTDCPEVEAYLQAQVEAEYLQWWQDQR